MGNVYAVMVTKGSGVHRVGWLANGEGDIQLFNTMDQAMYVAGVAGFPTRIATVVVPNATISTGEYAGIADELVLLGASAIDVAS